MFKIKGLEDEEEEEKRQVQQDKEGESTSDPFDFLNIRSNQKDNEARPKDFGMRDLRERGVSWAGLFHALAQRLQKKSKAAINKISINHKKGSKRRKSDQKSKRKSRMKQNRSSEREKN